MLVQPVATSLEDLAGPVQPAAPAVPPAPQPPHLPGGGRPIRATKRGTAFSLRLFDFSFVRAPLSVVFFVRKRRVSALV